MPEPRYDPNHQACSTQCIHSSLITPSVLSHRSVLADDDRTVQILGNKRVARALKVGEGLVLRQDANRLAIEDDIALEVEVVGVGNQLRAGCENLPVDVQIRVVEQTGDGKGGVSNGDRRWRVGAGLVVCQAEGDRCVVALGGEGGGDGGGREGEDGCECGLHFD